MAITKLDDKRTREFDAYAFPFNLAAPGAGITVARNIRKGTNFRLYKLTGFSTGVYILQIRDGTTRRDLFPEPVRNDCIVGNGQLPFELPITFTFLENGTIEVVIVDVSGAPNAGQLVMTGEAYLSGSGIGGQAQNISMT